MIFEKAIEPSGTPNISYNPEKVAAMTTLTPRPRKAKTGRVAV
jgi:hypothetical protein